MDRDELHRRIMILKEELEAGRLRLPPDADLGESLLRVRLAPDGMVDPDSVDASVRASALAIVALREHEELKQVPLRDVQAAYFDFLERVFAKPLAEMRKQKVTPHHVAAYMASTPAAVRSWAADAEDFFGGITEFWENYAPVVQAHAEDLTGLKACFGGDIFPSHEANIACSVGLYMDTIILPDPLLKVRSFPNAMAPERVFYYVAKHAVNALTYKELALADVDPPIVVGVPQPGNDRRLG